MKEKLKEIANKAKIIAIAVCGWDEKDLDSIEIDLDGNISVHFSHYHYGDTDYEIVNLTEEDMEVDIDTIEKYKKISEEKLKKQQDEKIKEEQRKKEAIEKTDRAHYERLKEKFKD